MSSPEVVFLPLPPPPEFFFASSNFFISLLVRFRSFSSLFFASHENPNQRPSLLFSCFPSPFLIALALSYLPMLCCLTAWKQCNR
jgi:SNF family Na+-dependent transporter